MNTVEAIDADELRDLYRELILDHARKPRHFGKLESATHAAQGINPLCGDKLHLYLQLENDVIRDASFEGSGCAISVASASLLTDTVIGMKTDDAIHWFDQVTDRLTNESANSDFDIGKLQALEGVREFPSRVKCATLAWHALHSAIEQRSTPASTE
ncbi:MAG: SUF system NifU family Fe-S cluster assembly protein [Gammaproteobacteria bacterium]|nr:SUF system NifU family Fe-S cluster assembly protein [Gammaproteobacteria bacterium]